MRLLGIIYNTINQRVPKAGHADHGFMQQDPAVAEGVMTAELFPFHVALPTMEL